MSTKKPQNANLILERLKKAYHMKYDAEIAELLEKDASTISTWKRRGTVDYAVIFSKCHDLNANYIIYGDMPIKREGLSRSASQVIHEPKNEYQVKNIITSIENLSIDPEEKIALLKMYLKILGDREKS